MIKKKGINNIKMIHYNIIKKEYKKIYHKKILK